MITKHQALEYFRSDDLILLGMAADEVRKQLHPGPIVTYSMDLPSDELTNTAVMPVVFRAQQSLEDVLNRLEEIRQRQLEHGDILAVMPRSEGTGVEHLKIIALTRIYLDNISHVQASWQGGLKIGQVGLRFGANDIDGAEAGSVRATEEDIRRIIRDAGFVPKQRDALFRLYYLN